MKSKIDEMKNYIEYVYGVSNLEYEGSRLKNLLAYNSKYYTTNPDETKLRLETANIPQESPTDSPIEYFFKHNDTRRYWKYTCTKDEHQVVELLKGKN